MIEEINNELDIEQVNKGGTNQKPNGITLVKFAVLAIGTLLVANLSACIFPTYAEASATDTPEIAKTINPTDDISTPRPTPVVTPKVQTTEIPTPSPTAKVELTYDQKRMLLGIDEDFKSYKVGSLRIFNVNFEMSNGKTIDGRMFTISPSDGNKSDEDKICSATNREYLFSIKTPKNEQTLVIFFYKYLSQSSPVLKNLELENSVSLSNMATMYDSWGLDYKNYQYLKDLSILFEKDGLSVLNAELTEEEIIDIIINSTDDDKIIPFWVYTPGATIPEELKGIYSEADYPPAVASKSSRNETILLS